MSSGIYLMAKHCPVGKYLFKANNIYAKAGSMNVALAFFT